MSLDRNSDIFNLQKAAEVSSDQQELSALSKHVSVYVRAAVAANPSISLELVELLAKDTEGAVRVEIAKNPSTPSEIRQKLANDSYERVRDAAKLGVGKITPLNSARQSGNQYVELANMYDAATTDDKEQLENYRIDKSHAVRFSTFCNPLTLVTSSDLKSDPLIKYAAVFNPSTTTEILDEIGLNQTSLNPVIPETIHAHKNVSKEFQVFRAITDLGINDELYDDETEKYFYEAIFDDGQVQAIIDLESLEALFYLYILGFIEAPAPTRDFWEYFLDSEPKNITENIEMFGSLPAIPESLYGECEAVVGARCIAGAWSKNPELLRTLAWDKQLLDTGVGGFYWQDSRSPRSSVAANENTPADLLRTILKEESEDSAGLSEFPHPVLWRLSCNPAAPEDVIEGIISLIEHGLVTDDYAQSELLVGEPDDFPYGLVTNPAVKGANRARVEALMRERDLDPADYEIAPA